MAKTLVDAGPLVAVIDHDEHLHDVCVNLFRRESGPLITVWPALTEAMHFLAAWPHGQEALLEFIEGGVLELASLDRDDIPHLRALMKKYSDQPMDLADAALVRVAERDRIPRILTLDRRDFSIYRIGRAGRFDITP